uniref:Lipocalin-like domain-containing protein n=1 Tax=Angiostrongylus cantonensis TaxID=6313 RepID=A0A0K0DL87_ANGCA
MDLSPPVGWTYFPPKTEALKSIINGCGFVQSSDNYQIWYFVGQSNDSLIAKQRANNEITASVSGAVTQTAPGGTNTGDFVFTAYTKLVRVTLSNAASNRYTWNIVKNTFMQKLSLGFNARFNGEVTISRN